MLYMKKRILNKILIGDITFDLKNVATHAAKVSNSQYKEGKIDNAIRSAIIKRLDPTHFPDFCKDICDYGEEFNPLKKSDDLCIREIEYLKYGLSDHFLKHQDIADGRDRRALELEAKVRIRPRRLTTITMLSKTDDLIGGQLSVWESEHGKEHVIDLQVGETVIFYSTAFHGVTAVTQGGREVLVAWVYDR